MAMDLIEKKAWACAIVVWTMGAAPIFYLWYWHPEPRWLDEFLSFAVSIAAFFYIFVALKLKEVFETWLRRRSPPA